MQKHLCNLTCDNKTLLARIDELNINPRISGMLVIDTTNNSLIDIQNVFNDANNKKLILEFFDNKYELFITGIQWNFIDLDDEEDTIGHFAEYHCCFQAMPIENNKNNVVWDCGSDSDDMYQLIGSSLYDVAKKALFLIEKYRFYNANTEWPTPSCRAGADWADDVAAIIACSKPATVFDVSFLNNKLIVFLLREAQARGFKIETVDNFNSKSIVVGIPYNVRQIVQIIERAVSNNETSDYYYERLGNLVGLPSESIDFLIRNMKK